MSKWVSESLQSLLDQINEVPYTDDREKLQLNILMNGFMKLNNQAMSNAASKTREHIRDWTLEEENSDNDSSQNIKVKSKKPEVDELSRLRPIR